MMLNTPLKRVILRNLTIQFRETTKANTLAKEVLRHHNNTSMTHLTATIAMMMPLAKEKHQTPTLNIKPIKSKGKTRPIH